jgi:hypothetical protein
MGAVEGIAKPNGNCIDPRAEKRSAYAAVVRDRNLSELAGQDGQTLRLAWGGQRLVIDGKRSYLIIAGRLADAKMTLVVTRNGSRPSVAQACDLDGRRYRAVRTWGTCLDDWTAWPGKDGTLDP